MTVLVDVSAIAAWHAHVYFDASSRDAAFALREQVIEVFGESVAVGRFHERPVGPHPLWSFQVAFKPEQFAQIVVWLTLNRGALDILVHPNTDDVLRDHRDCAIWLGCSHQLDLGRWADRTTVRQG